MNSARRGTGWAGAALLGMCLCAASIFAQLTPAGAQDAAADAAIGDLFAPSGAAKPAGSGLRILSGSTVSAGSAPATLQLLRGGEVRVCPGSSISVAAADHPSGRSLMLSLNVGALETNFALAATADTVVTPDFRVQLPGPGVFHLGINADAGGNVCVGTLPGNTAAVVVNELMGAGSYQVRTGEAVYFRAGNVTGATPATAACGCPGAGRGAAAPSAPGTGATPSATGSAPAPSTPAPLSATPPATAPGEVHIQVDAPVVYSAVAPAPEPSAIARSPEPVLVPVPEVIAPGQGGAVKNMGKKKGILKRLGGFFAKIFK